VVHAKSSALTLECRAATWVSADDGPIRLVAPRPTKLVRATMGLGIRDKLRSSDVHTEGSTRAILAGPTRLTATEIFGPSSWLATFAGDAMPLIRGVVAVSRGVG
jgi:hypothetical protein